MALVHGAVQRFGQVPRGHGHTFAPYVTYGPLFARFGSHRYHTPRRARRIGQNVFSDLFGAGVSVAENIAGGLPLNAPNAGGGSLTIDHPFVAQHDFTLPTGQTIQAGQTVQPITQYVNAQGQDQSTPDPTAGQTPLGQAGPGGLLVAAAAVGALWLLFVRK